MARSGAELDDKEVAILEYIEQQPGRFAATPEIAETLDLTTNGASYRLKKLEDKGEIDSRIPSRDQIWYVRDTAASRSAIGAVTGIFPRVPNTSLRIGVYGALTLLVLVIAMAAISGSGIGWARGLFILLLGSALAYVWVYGASLLIGVYKQFIEEGGNHE